MPRMHPALSRVDHRPWPVPPGRWAWRQSWHDLLFAHWPISAAELASLVPSGLTLQERDGAAWIGIVPFRMTGVTLRKLPALPGLSVFPELNVRTYVERGGKPGVWFFSLDAGNQLAVWTARMLLSLPYHHARIRLGGSESIDYHAVRTAGGAARFDATYRPSGQVYESEPGTLAHWLTERYCLYSGAPGGGILRTEVHHRPWPLQPAEAEIRENGMLSALGLRTMAGPPLLHFSRRLDVIGWLPVKA